jgi:acetylornithine deacetylase/succinyl-diaminopimelate desuccinylase-like protein
MRIFLTVVLFAASAAGQDWSRLEEETMRHFQAILRIDSSDPPGNEKAVVDYLKKVLEGEGIPVKIFALEGHRPNLVARLKGNGRKRPLLLMGHTDVVNVDRKKWKTPPFGGTRSGGHVYSRGTLDDKDNVVASLMTMLVLKRSGVALDRDVIFLAEAGEEGSTRYGIEFMVKQHFAEIEAEFCIAEAGDVVRRGGKARFARVETTEKIPYGLKLVAHGPAGHGSIPLRTNAIARLAQAVAKVSAWQPPLRMNDTTRTYFERLATVSTPEEAARYNGIADPAKTGAIQEYFAMQEPRHYSMLRTSISPNIVGGGYRINVIPSEAEATLDVRVFPGDDINSIAEMIRGVINDPAVEVVRGERDTRPPAQPSSLKSEAFLAIEKAITRHYGVPTLPMLQTGATDMSYLRMKGIESYGVGPATDEEDILLGYAMHSDQERILEAELHRFVKFHYDAALEIAGAK